MIPTTRIFPFLRYEDAPAAFEWLARAFGFEKQMLVPGPDGTIAHAQLRYGGSLIMIGSARDDVLHLKSPAEVGGATQGIYVHVDDVDAHHDRANRRELPAPRSSWSWRTRSTGHANTWPVTSRGTSGASERMRRSSRPTASRVHTAGVRVAPAAT